MAMDGTHNPTWAEELIDIDEAYARAVANTAWSTYSDNNEAYNPSNGVLFSELNEYYEALIEHTMPIVPIEVREAPFIY